ncbi:MAG: alpha/beta fold hydrolase [Candidatus Caldatribacteriaceae bacterium]
MVKRLLWIILLIITFVPLTAAHGFGQKSPFENGRFWEKNHLFLHYRIWLPSVPRGKVLLVHGLGGSTFSWRHAPDFFLRTGYLVVAVDLPGFGYSQRVTGMANKRENQVQMLLDFLRYLDTEVLPSPSHLEKWHLVGHSMGGAMVFLMAMQEPERFQRVVLIDAALRSPSNHLLKALVTFPLTRGCWTTLIRNIFLSPSGVKRSLRAAYGRVPTAEEFQGYYTPLKLPGTAQSLLSLLRNTSPFKLSPFRQKLHPPFLLIWGEKDRFVSVKQGEKFQKIFPETLLHVVQGASHCPMETHPEEVYPLIVDFFTASKEEDSQKVPESSPGLRELNQ